MNKLVSCSVAAVMMMVAEQALAEAVAPPAQAASSAQAADSSSAAPAEAQKPVVKPPAYSLARWSEDYSYLRDAPAGDFWDPIKFIPIGDEAYLTIGGQVRERYEYFSDLNFGSGTQDHNGYYLTRLQLSGDLHLNNALRFYVEGRSAMIDGRSGGPRGSDADEIDLDQAFVDLKLPLFTGEKDSSTIRFGRQYLIYGAQRLISPSDWGNARRTFEGVRIMNKIGDHQLDFILVRPVTVSGPRLNNGDGNQTFYGVYDSISLPQVFDKSAGTKLEGYFLVLNQQADASRKYDADTYTLGARFASTPRPWDFDSEVDYQFGNVGSDHFDAFSLAIEAGYTFDTALSPRVSLGLDYATKDFNALFPSGHTYFGYIDAIGRRNIIDLHPGLQIGLVKDQQFAKNIGLRIDYHMFWRADSDSAVYNSGGSVLRADNGSDARFIGSEIDLLLTWQIDRHLMWNIGYSHFFPGDFISQTGASDDIDMFYTTLQYMF